MVLQPDVQKTSFQSGRFPRARILYLLQNVEQRTNTVVRRTRSNTTELLLKDHCTYALGAFLRRRRACSTPVSRLEIATVAATEMLDRLHRY